MAIGWIARVLSSLGGRRVVDPMGGAAQSDCVQTKTSFSFGHFAVRGEKFVSETSRVIRNASLRKL
jgi:hypothetical protein